MSIAKQEVHQSLHKPSGIVSSSRLRFARRPAGIRPTGTRDGTTLHNASRPELDPNFFVFHATEASNLEDKPSSTADVACSLWLSDCERTKSCRVAQRGFMKSFRNCLSCLFSDMRMFTQKSVVSSAAFHGSLDWLNRHEPAKCALQYMPAMEAILLCKCPIAAVTHQSASVSTAHTHQCTSIKDRMCSVWFHAGSLNG